MSIYFSSLTGNKIDNVIEVLNQMRPQIKITGATPNSMVTCYCEETDYDETTQADASGNCIFYISAYGDYVINDSVTQPMYAYKIVEVDLS